MEKEHIRIVVSDQLIVLCQAKKKVNVAGFWWELRYLQKNYSKFA